MEEVALRPQPPRRPFAVVGGFVLLAVLVLGGYAGLRRLSASKDASAPQVVTAPAPVQVLAVKPGPIRTVLTYSGAVQASQQVNISPRAAGQLVAVTVEVGSAVRAGDRVASLDPGTLSAQLQQAQAAQQSAQAKLALIISGSRPADIAAAQAAYDAAQAKLNQLLNPTASDLAAADSALQTAQSAFQTATANVDGTKASLLGAVSAYCNFTFSFGVPCGNITYPLPAEVVANVSSAVQTAVGLPTSDVGQRAITMLTANTAYSNALANVASAKQAVVSAQAKRDALASPSASDVAAQRSAVEAARNALDSKQNPYTDADVQAARAAVAQADAQVAVARTNLDQTTIVAPFDGVIVQKMLDVGATVTTQTPVFSMIARALEVHVTVEEARIGQVRPGMDAELTVPGYAGKLFRGKVAAIGPTGDARAHTFDVKVMADDPEGQLKPGMFAQVAIVTAQRNDALLVPNAAVIQQGTSARVFVITNGKAAARPVKVGISDTTNTEILDGIVAGDAVVIFGQNTLRDGQAVLVSTPVPGAGGGAPGGGAQPGQRPGANGAGPSPSASPAARP